MSYIVLLVIVAMPIYNYFFTKLIRSRGKDSEKEKGYYQIYIVYWFVFLLISISNPINNMLNAIYTINFNLLTTMVICLLIVYMISTTFLPIFLIPFNKQLRDDVHKSYDDRLYPVTSKQQTMFVFVAITVGVCESFIYWGFLYQFMISNFHIVPVWSYFIAVLIFGISHYMQGIKGVVNSMVFGLIIGFLFNLTGSLILPIIVHIIYDSKSIYIAKLINRK